jgi:hypothetical protein
MSFEPKVVSSIKPLQMRLNSLQFLGILDSARRLASEWRQMQLEAVDRFLLTVWN